MGLLTDRDRRAGVAFSSAMAALLISAVALAVAVVGRSSVGHDASQSPPSPTSASGTDSAVESLVTSGSETVSLLQLVVLPERFDHHRVAVRGYLRSDLNHASLYLDQESALRAIDQNAVPVEFAAPTERVGYEFICGTFEILTASGPAVIAPTVPQGALRDAKVVARSRCE